MKLLILETLALETTRKCNMQCKHCLRGNAQNLDIDLSYIDDIFNIKIRDYEMVFYRLVFSGGEPFLNKNAIIYTINKIIKEKICVCSIQITTNATIFDEEIIEGLEKFATYTLENFSQFLEGRNKKPVEIIISNDQFHSVNLSVIQKFENLNKSFFIIIYTGKFENKEEIRLTGRALENIKYKKTKPFKKPLTITKINKNFFAISGEIYLTAKGYLLTDVNKSFGEMDNENFKHIKTLKKKNSGIL